MSEQTPRKWRTIFQKAGISVAFGCVMAALAVPVNWHENRNNWRFNPEQDDTRWRLHDILYDLNEYGKANGSAPDSLSQLRPEATGYYRHDTGSIVDGWGRPIHYAVVDGKGIATSYGLDGQPGGIGFDYDFSTEDLSDIYSNEPDAAHPTFRQFVCHVPWHLAFQGAVCVGVFSALVCFELLKRTKLSCRNIVAVAIPLLVVTGFAIFVAAFLTAGETSGH